MQQDNTENTPTTITPDEMAQLFGDPRASFALRGAVVNAIDELRTLSHAATSTECDGRAMASALHTLADRLEVAAAVSLRAGRVSS